MASRDHKVLVIGVGSVGERHVRCFQATGRAKVSLVEINRVLRSTVAERYGVPGYASTAEALRDGPTAAVVAAPAHVHIPLAMEMVDAGLSLLIEKPLSVSLEGIEDLKERIARRGIIAGVAYVYRSFPALAAMKQAIDAGQIG